MLQNSGNALQDVQVGKGCVNFLHFVVHNSRGRDFEASEKSILPTPTKVSRTEIARAKVKVNRKFLPIFT
jgi:hypothetical protein